MLSTTGGKLECSVTFDFLPVSRGAEYDRDATASGLLQKTRLRTHQEDPTWHPRAFRVEDRRSGDEMVRYMSLSESVSARLANVKYLEGVPSLDETRSSLDMSRRTRR